MAAGLSKRRYRQPDIPVLKTAGLRKRTLQRTMENLKDLAELIHWDLSRRRHLSHRPEGHGGARTLLPHRRLTTPWEDMDMVIIGRSA